MTTENQLIQLFMPIIQTGLTADGFTSVILMQDFQPTQQGFNDAPTVAFHLKNDHAYGFQHIETSYDPIEEQMTELTQQWHETTFQFSFYAPQTPQVIDIPTAADLYDEVRFILQYRENLALFNASNVSLLRIIEAPIFQFNDDRDRFEPQCAFDCIFTRSTTRTRIIPVINSIQPGLYPV